MKQSGFNDIKLLHEYLQTTEDSADVIARLLKDGSIADIALFETILVAVVQRAETERSAVLKELLVA